MDHDHETGLFRAVVCRACNTGDRYIKYPHGYDRKKKTKEYREAKKEDLSKYFKEYQEANRESISKKKREKYTCDCGVIGSIGNKARHNKTLKHTTWEKTISP
jgi:hypothetical protein